ncbi:MAG TPA: RNA polymerase sigma factor, partial [Vulgatibacter sp.]
AMIREGISILTEALHRGLVGPYQIQAAIAAIHDEAGSAEDTDWAQILGLYGLLLQMADNPMVALNHAIAAAMVHGPRVGLERLDALAPRLGGHHRLHAARAHLLERVGDVEGATSAYLRASAGTSSLPERNYLVLRASRLRGESTHELREPKASERK